MRSQVVSRVQMEDQKWPKMRKITLWYDHCSPNGMNMNITARAESQTPSKTNGTQSQRIKVKWHVNVCMNFVCLSFLSRDVQILFVYHPFSRWKINTAIYADLRMYNWYEAWPTVLTQFQSIMIVVVGFLIVFFLLFVVEYWQQKQNPFSFCFGFEPTKLNGCAPFRSVNRFFCACALFVHSFRL